MVKKKRGSQLFAVNGMFGLWWRILVTRPPSPALPTFSCGCDRQLRRSGDLK